MSVIDDMEQIKILLKETGFLQVDNHDLENILKPGQDRLELIQWCLKEVDEKHSTKLAEVRDDHLKDELMSLLQKLGLCCSDDRDIVLGGGGNKDQISFWLDLLNIVKCVQHRNNLSEVQQLKTFSNTSNMWCELLKDNKYKESLKIKMKLVPIELKSAVQLKSNPLMTDVQDKDFLLRQLQALQEDTQEHFDKTDLLTSDDEISLANLKSYAEKLKEFASAIKIVYQDDLNSHSSQAQYQGSRNSSEVKSLENILSNIVEEIHTFNEGACFLKILVNGFQAAVLWKRNNCREADNENMANEISECIKLIEKYNEVKNV